MAATPLRRRHRDVCIDYRTESPAPRPAPQTPSTEFDEFWKKYPRKVGKQDARRAWDKALRTAQPSAIMEGLETLLAHLPENPKFIPHPTTWLHGGRWEDEEYSTPRPVRHHLPGGSNLADRFVLAAGRTLPS